MNKVWIRDRGLVRVFLAVPVRDAWKDQLLFLQKQLVTSIPPSLVCQWTHDSQFHMTVRFVGKIPKKSIKGLVRALSGVLCEHRPIRLPIQRVEAAPVHEPNVIWARFDATPSFRRLVSDTTMVIRRYVSADGIRMKNGHRLVAHVTLARARNAGLHVPAVIPDVRQTELPVDELVLYESRIGPYGSEYRPLHRFSLLPERKVV